MEMWNSRKEAYFSEEIKELATYKSDSKSMMQRKGKRHSLDPPEVDRKAGKSPVLNFSFLTCKNGCNYSSLTEDQI